MAIINETKDESNLIEKNKTIYEVENNMEYKVSSESITTGSFYGPEDEFSLNDVMGKKLENDVEALERATRTINILESKLNESNLEKENLAKELEQVKTAQNETENKLTSLNSELENYREKIIPEMEVKNQELQRDMETMGEKMIDEAERCAELLHSKQLLEAEIEDLSQKLFEEANVMVADERKLNYDWSIKFEKLQAQLNDTKNLLEFEKEQSCELKTKLSSLLEPDNPDTNLLSPAFIKKSRRTSSVVSSPLLRSITSSDSLVFDLSKCSNEIYADPTTPFSFKLDDIRFLEFKGFVLAPKPKGIYLASTFMKRSLAEDVDPTLKFHPKGSTWSSNKTLNVAAQLGNINILTNRTQLVDNVSCNLCSAVLPTPYTFSIKDQTEAKQSLCICCRNRLLAVCEFYALVRVVRAGVIKQSVEATYMDCLKIKHKMFLARVGASFTENEIKDDLESVNGEENGISTSSRSTPNIKVNLALDTLRESRSMPVSPLATTKFDRDDQELAITKDSSSDIIININNKADQNDEAQLEPSPTAVQATEVNQGEDTDCTIHQPDVSNYITNNSKDEKSQSIPVNTQINLLPITSDPNLNPWANISIKKGEPFQETDKNTYKPENTEFLKAPVSTNSSSLTSPAAGPLLSSFTS